MDVTDCRVSVSESIVFPIPQLLKKRESISSVFLFFYGLWKSHREDKSTRLSDEATLPCGDGARLPTTSLANRMTGRTVYFSMLRPYIKTDVLKMH